MLGDVVVLVVVGVVVYVIVRALQQRGEWSGPSRPSAPRRGPAVRRTPPGPPPRMVAPDDDEDFLRDLDRRRRNPGSPE